MAPGPQYGRGRGRGYQGHGRGPQGFGRGPQGRGRGHQGHERWHHGYGRGCAGYADGVGGGEIRGTNYLKQSPQHVGQVHRFEAHNASSRAENWEKTAASAPADATSDTFEAADARKREWTEAAIPGVEGQMEKWRRKRSRSEAGLPQAPDDHQPGSSQPGHASDRCEQGAFNIKSRVESVLASAAAAPKKRSPSEMTRVAGVAKWSDVFDAPFRRLMPGMIKIMPSGNRSGSDSQAEDGRTGSLSDNPLLKKVVEVTEDEVERWQAPWMAGLMDRTRLDGKKKELDIDGGISGRVISKPPQISDPARADDNRGEQLSDLHHEIMRFSDYVSLTPAEVKARENIKSSVKAAAVKAFGPGASVGFFGSYGRDGNCGTEITSPDESLSIFLSDVDIFVKPKGDGDGDGLGGAADYGGSPPGGPGVTLNGMALQGAAGNVDALEEGSTSTSSGSKSRKKGKKRKCGGDSCRGHNGQGDGDGSGEAKNGGVNVGDFSSGAASCRPRDGEKKEEDKGMCTDADNPDPDPTSRGIPPMSSANQLSVRASEHATSCDEEGQSVSASPNLAREEAGRMAIQQLVTDAGRSVGLGLDLGGGWHHEGTLPFQEGQLQFHISSEASTEACPSQGRVAAVTTTRSSSGKMNTNSTAASSATVNSKKRGGEGAKGKGKEINSSGLKMQKQFHVGAKASPEIHPSHGTGTTKATPFSAAAAGSKKAPGKLTDGKKALKKLMKKKTKAARSGLKNFGEELNKKPWITCYEFKYAAEGCLAPNIQVPIIAWRDARSGVKSDIAWGGHGQAKELRAQIGPAYFVAMFPGTFLPLVKFLKVLMHQKDVDKPFAGGVGSFKLYVLVAAYLETCVVSSSTAGSADLGQLLMGFLRHYSSDSQEHLTQGTKLHVKGVKVNLKSAYRSGTASKAFKNVFRLLSKPALVNTSSSGGIDLGEGGEGDLELQRSRGRRGSILGRVIWGSDLRKERETRLAAAGSAKASPAPEGPEPVWHRKLEALSSPGPRNNGLISAKAGGAKRKNFNSNPEEKGGQGAQGPPKKNRKKMGPPKKNSKKMTKAQKKAARMSPAVRRKADAQRKSAAERKAAGHYKGYKLKTLRKLFPNRYDEMVNQIKKNRGGSGS